MKANQKLKQIEKMKTQLLEQLEEAKSSRVKFLESSVKVDAGEYSVSSLIDSVTRFNAIMETTYTVRPDNIVMDTVKPRSKQVRANLAKFLSEEGYKVRGINPQKFLESQSSKRIFDQRKIGIGPLLENELARAELVIAAQGIADKMASMTEELAKMEVDNLMPLVDSLKQFFGVEAAEEFNQITSQAIDQSMETIRGYKDQITNSILKLENAIGDEANVEGPSDLEMDGSQGDAAADTDMGADDLAADGEEGGDLGVDDVGAEEPVDDAGEGGDIEDELGAADLEGRDKKDDAGEEPVDDADALAISEWKSYRQRGRSLRTLSETKSKDKKLKEKKHDVDGDGDTDAADYMAKRRMAGGQSKSKAIAATRKHND